MENLDKLDLDLRLLYLQQATEFTDDQVESELSRMESDAKGVDIPQVAKAKLISSLSQTLHTTTLGRLLENHLQQLKLSPEDLSAATQIPQDVLADLIADRVYTNSVPILYLSNLLKTLKVTFEDAQRSIQTTFEKLQYSGFESAGSYAIRPAFRKGMFASHENDLPLKNAGRELFENNEAVNKYVNRLKDLMK